MKQKKELYQIGKGACIIGAILLTAAAFAISVFCELFNWDPINFLLGVLFVAIVVYIIEFFYLVIIRKEPENGEQEKKQENGNK